MTNSAARRLFAAATWLVAVALLLWPAAALLARTVTEGAAPAGGFTYSGRQLGLLWRSVWLAATATVGCVLFAIPSVWALSRMPRAARSRTSRAVVVTLAACLLCPPMVYVFAWQRILPAATNGYLECIGVWAMWAWPVPALILAAAWRTTGRSSYEAARLEASATQAFLRIALPALRGPIALCLLILFVIFLGEYAVPHTCGLLVYATELLGWSTSSLATIDTLWPALPIVAIAASGLAGAALLWRSEERSAQRGVDSDAGMSKVRPAAVVLGTFAVTWLLPVGALAASISSVSAVGEAVRIYGTDMLSSMGVATLSGVLVITVGLMLTIRPRLRTAALVVAIAFGAFPGALVGEALVAAYNYDTFRILYDHWPIMTLGYATRFAWIGCLITLAFERRHQHLTDQALTDGAGPIGQLLYLKLPMWLPTLLFGAAAVIALALGDVATTTLIRVPDFNPIAHVIIEKFHRREDDMLISLSIGVVLTALPAALLAISLAKTTLQRRSAPAARITAAR